MIRLRGFKGWSAPLLFSCKKVGFSHGKAQLNHWAHYRVIGCMVMEPKLFAIDASKEKADNFSDKMTMDLC